MITLRTSILVVALGAALSGLLAGDAATVGVAPPADSAATAARTAWNEVKWPFPLDQWGLGKAYRCTADDCGIEISLYLRAKIGFCNCATGVADDPELDRVGDLALLGDRVVGLADGREITVGYMKGRSRPYRVDMRDAAPVTALAIGFNDRCDVAVATVVADYVALAAADRLAVEFLNSKLILRWAELEFGL
jgi:hypothetical protein